MTLRMHGLGIILLASVVNFIEASQPELQLVSVVFRHGDRAPADDGKELYPNDPYLNYSFYPMGLGGLTNQGKSREFRLGTILRQRYNDFLGSVYLPSAVESRSTDYDRTKMSLQLVLAGLYPPTPIQQWNKNLLWQPIPTTYKTGVDDALLIPEECPLYKREFNRVLSSEKAKENLATFSGFLSYLSAATGKNMTTAEDMYYLYHTLMAESSMGLPLPAWVNDTFPYGLLWFGAILQYDLVSYNVQLKRLNGGMLVRKITNDMQKKMNDELPKGRKIYLYSGHETNVAALLQSLGVYEPHVPEYSSAVILELYYQESRPYVKVLYYFGIPPVVTEMTIPGCNGLCPLDKFLTLMHDVIPTGSELRCVKNEMDPNLPPGGHHHPGVVTLDGNNINL